MDEDAPTTVMNARVQLYPFHDAEALAKAAASRWLGASAPLAENVAVSGGKMGRLFLAAAAEVAAAEPGAARKIRQTHFYWADERCVPPTHAESNYRLAREALFDPLGLSPALVHRLKGELEIGRAVEEANGEIVQTVPCNAAGMPVLDLVFLGMGEDGHVASIFPQGTTLCALEGMPYAAVIGPKPPNPRITLNFSALAVAREVWVLIGGEGKEASLWNSFEGKDFTPLGRLMGLRERTSVFVDHFLNKMPPAGVECIDNSVGAVR